MESLVLPIVLVVLSNIFYHTCAKFLPKDINPFATLLVVYVIAAICSGILLMASTVWGDSAITELKKTSWYTVIIGISVLGLELGFIWAYRVGWNISTAALTANMCLSAALILVGIGLFKESLSFNQIIGIVLCSAGLFFMNT